MNTYHVTWEIDIEAGTPQEAAQEALRIQRDPSSMAVVFDIHDEAGELTAVDLMDDVEECAP